MTALALVQEPHLLRTLVLPLLATFALQTSSAAEHSPEYPTTAAELTVALSSPLALQAPLPGLSEDEQQQFFRGRALFNQLWVAAPSLDSELDGLGPTHNQSSCAACHLRNGRGQPPASARERLRGMLVRLSVRDEDGNTQAHPHYGEQLQDAAIAGVPAEGRAVVNWVEHEEQFADGTVIRLRKPELTLVDMAFGASGPELLLSPRVAPPLIGAGLLDAIPDSALEALAAQARPDGISGRVNRVPDPASGQVHTGRFGWKANSSSLHQQTAAAFSGDLGITSSLFPEENCPPVQAACLSAPSESPDITDAQLAAVVFYQAALAIPARRDAEAPEVQQGARLFNAAGCQHCHVPELVTGNSAILPALSNQRLAPYTDLLLHDMGEALADNRPDHLADGREWRTPPLWGLGLIETVNEHNTLLHDGRARGVLEAILWHGGEAEAARERVRHMPQDKRAALVRFVNSL